MVDAAPTVGHSDRLRPERPIIPKFESSIATLYGANSTNIRAYNHQYNMRFAANYVTGSHAFKVGMQDMWGTRNFTYDTNQRAVLDASSTARRVASRSTRDRSRISRS